MTSIRSKMVRLTERDLRGRGGAGDADQLDESRRHGQHDVKVRECVILFSKSQIETTVHFLTEKVTSRRGGHQD